MLHIELHNKPAIKLQESDYTSWELNGRGDLLVLKDKNRVLFVPTGNWVYVIHKDDAQPTTTESQKNLVDVEIQKNLMIYADRLAP